MVVIRWCITGALLIGIYSETGVWTTLAMLLMGIAIDGLAQVRH